MAANAGNIFAGIGQDLVTGTVLSSVFDSTGATRPATTQAFFEALTTLNAAWKDSGYIGEKGITLSTGRKFTDIKDMDGTILDSIQTEFNGELKTEFLELNEWTLKNLFGPDNVQVTAATADSGIRTRTVITGEDLDPRSWIFCMRASRRRVGIIVPKGRITEQGDLAFTSSGAVSIACTIKTIPVYDAALHMPVDCYIVTDDGLWGAVSTAPVIQSILPTGRSIGEAITIRGTRFTGTTGVTIDTVPVVADTLTVVNDSTIVAIIPAGTLTDANVIVTTATGGASAAVSYVVV